MTDPYSRAAIRGSLGRQPLVVANWKMNPATIHEAVALAQLESAADTAAVDVGIAPPATALRAVAEVIEARRAAARPHPTPWMLFAQDVHWEERGAYTGQISAAMLAGVADGTIVGHSEVRRDQGDDDARVARKAAAALRRDLYVVYCIGESADERRSGQTDAVIERQVRHGIGAIEPDLLVQEGRHMFAVAYEPIWAIGTGVAATAAQASEAIAKVRDELMRLGFGGKAVRILYGGSVSAANVAEFANAEGVDGALVGGASLKPAEFAAIIKAFS